MVETRASRPTLPARLFILLMAPHESLCFIMCNSERLIMNIVYRSVLFLSIATAVLITAGCNRGPKLVKVSGRVLIDGKPLEKGFVQVIPKDQRAATGQIDKEGRYTLTTFEAGDGCVLGTHEVTVLANESRGPTALHWFAPKKYSEPNTSGLTLEIKEETDSADINLTWDGGKPFTEKFEDEGLQPPAGEGN